MSQPLFLFPNQSESILIGRVLGGNSTRDYIHVSDCYWCRLLSRSYAWLM